MRFFDIRLAAFAIVGAALGILSSSDATAQPAAPAPAAKSMVKQNTSLAECLTLPADKTITMNGMPSDVASSVGAWYADAGCPDFVVDVVITSDAMHVDASKYFVDQLLIEADRANMSKEDCEKYLEKFVMYKKGADGKFDRLGGGMREGRYLLMSASDNKNCKTKVRPGWDVLPGNFKAPQQGSVTYRVVTSGRIGFTGPARAIDVKVQHGPKQ